LLALAVLVNRFLNALTLSMYFCDYFSFEEDLPLYLNKFEFSSPKVEG
jgi:hypothetical protein